MCWLAPCSSERSRSQAGPLRLCSRFGSASAPHSSPSLCALIAVNWIFVLKLLPSFEAYKPAPGLAAVLKERATPDDIIVTYNVALPSLVYYLRRHIDVFYDHGPVIELLRTGRPLFLMASRDDYERAIKPDESAPLCRVRSQPTFDVKLRNVLSRQRLPEILLLTNKCGP